jgi:carboxylesterase type B
MVFGSNLNEGGLFALGDFASVNVSADNYTIFLNGNFGAGAPLVAAKYPLTLAAFNSFPSPPPGFPSPSPAYLAISAILTDAQFVCPLHQAMLKAEANNIPVYTYLNSHVPTCQWLKSPPQVAIYLVGATHTSEIPLVFGNGINQPLIANSTSSCNFTTLEWAISEDLIASWTAMAETGNPSTGNLQWPAWDNSSSKGVTITNSTGVGLGVVDYSFCQFWDMINLNYLSFNSSNLNLVNGTGGNGNGSGVGGSGSGNSTGTGKQSGAEKGVEMGVWGLTIVVGMVLSVLMG